MARQMKKFTDAVMLSHLLRSVLLPSPVLTVPILQTISTATLCVIFHLASSALKNSLISPHINGD